MDGIFCVIRVSKSDAWMVAWWFSETTIGGKLILERYCEYTALENDDRVLPSFVKTRELSNVTVPDYDPSKVFIPKDVLLEATGKVTRSFRS